eukprot:11032496-Lingulodinium_polyedra.AAC.1
MQPGHCSVYQRAEANRWARSSEAYLPQRAAQSSSSASKSDPGGKAARAGVFAMWKPMCSREDLSASCCQTPLRNGSWPPPASSQYHCATWAEDLSALDCRPCQDHKLLAKATMMRAFLCRPSIIMRMVTMWS